MKLFNDVHQFAFYTETVRYIVQHNSNLDIHQIKDPVIINRVLNVLRLKKGENITLFDTHNNILCTIIGINSEDLTVELHEISHNNILSPNIKWILPLYKKEAFEEAIYILTEMGVQAIQPVVTKKTQRLWGNQKEEDRCRRIMIAAAEQSKQFILPSLLPILPLDICVKQIDAKYTTKIFFDPSGSKLSQVIEAVKIEHNQIVALVGPEGDLTHDEKLMLSEENFVFCSLTKTILRAQQAISVGLGALRSLL